MKTFDVFLSTDDNIVFYFCDASRATEQPIRRWTILIGHFLDEHIVLNLLLFGGVFHIRIVVHEEPASISPYRDSADPDRCRLQLPSKRLALVCNEVQYLDQLELVAAAYDVHFQWDTHEEHKHSFLKEVEEYPAEDGPDGVLTLWPCASGA